MWEEHLIINNDECPFLSKECESCSRGDNVYIQLYFSIESYEST